MHFLITIAVIAAGLAFAFGEGVARGFIQGLFILAGLAIVLLLWDFYREIPVKSQYKVIELEIYPKKQRTNQATGWNFK